MPTFRKINLSIFRASYCCEVSVLLFHFKGALFCLNPIENERARAGRVSGREIERLSYCGKANGGRLMKSDHFLRAKSKKVFLLNWRATKRGERIF